jgi:hypothetical protein
MRLLNLKASRLIGELLELIKEAQVAGEVHTVDDAIQFARAHIDRNRRIR